MKLPQPLQPGKLLRRYQRFLADIELPNKTVVTAHTPNTGSMSQCCTTGAEVLLSTHHNPKRKLSYTWELVRVNRHWVDINTQRTNHVVAEALTKGFIIDLKGYTVHREIRFGSSRIDFLLQRHQETILLEIKNVTLCCQVEIACFPDAVSLRAQKHLRELMAAKRLGWRAMVLFLVQRGEAKFFGPADHVDPVYGQLLREAAKTGVEIRAYNTLVTSQENRLNQALPVILNGGDLQLR